LNKIKEKIIVQGCVYQKYYLKKNNFILKSKFIYAKDKKKIIDESKKSLQKLNTHKIIFKKYLYKKR
jgi:hypothetical protein